MRVHANDGFDRIDGGNAVRASALCRFRRRVHGRHVRRQFRQHGNGARALRGAGKTFHQFRHLADIAAQAALRHVGAGEIQFHRIRAVLFAQPGKLAPFRFIFSHNGCQDELGGILRLQPAEYLHVFRHAVVRKLLDIFETDNASVIPCDCGKPRGRLMDIQGADRLEADSGPSCLKCPGTHVVCAGHHGGRQQERILQRNPAQVTLQPALVFRKRRLTFRLHLIMQPVHQIPDRHLSRPHARLLTGSFAGQARVFFRQMLRRGLFISEPDIPQQFRRFQFSACVIAGRVFTQYASDHIRPGNTGSRPDHSVFPPLVSVPQLIPFFLFLSSYIA